MSDSVLVFTFGRFNPPHIGHDRLIKWMKETADFFENAQVRLYATHTSDPSKNIIPYAKKSEILSEAFPDIFVKSDIKDIISLLKHVSDFDTVIWVVGDDREDDCKRILQYNGTEAFTIKNLELSIVPRTKRSDASGTSSTKMRKWAKKNPSKFLKSCPKKLKVKTKKEMLKVFK